MVLGIIFGILGGLSLAYFITGCLLKRSNEFGNWEGTFSDFSKDEDFVILEKEDNIEENRKLSWDKNL